MLNLTWVQEFWPLSSAQQVNECSRLLLVQIQIMICVQEFWRLSSAQHPIIRVQVQQLYDIKSFNNSEIFQVQTPPTQPG